MESPLELKEFCALLPKVELHAHLNTSYSRESLQQLVTLAGSDLDVNQLAISGRQDMDLSFALFPKIQKLVQTEEAVYKLTYCVIVEHAEDNVKYLELRSTPKDIPATGMTQELYLRTMLRAVRDCEREGRDIMVRLLPSIDRRLGLDVARVTVDLAEKLMKETEGLVIGIDLSGDPKIADAADYIPLLLDASCRGLKLALHLAEIPLYEETKKVLEACLGRCEMRVGHGTFLHRFENVGAEIEDLVLKGKFPIEACITSNLKTLTVDSVEEHHFKYWLDKGHPVLLCTDGKGVYGCALSDEYLTAAQAFHLSKDFLKQHVLSTVDYIFESESVKDKLKSKFRTSIYSLK